ncbi:hypothetical protein WCQ02_41320, partial [Paraburkholderia tropica]|uniref:SMODS domain-containing nucleotidyltransferase n=1 Tax=Paraburkholderia tropica TaxID=92647 RepID=UPI00304F30E4
SENEDHHASKAGRPTCEQTLTADTPNVKKDHRSERVLCRPSLEVLPAFVNNDGSYTYADANNGGSWRICKPKHEMETFSARNMACNCNLVELSRMVRAWRDTNNVSMSGMLIDTLAYQFLGTWTYRDKSYLYYDWMTRDFFSYLANLDKQQTYWLAPGSGTYVYRRDVFQYKARSAELRALEALEYRQNNHDWSARQKYREIYGTAFPA